MKILAGILKILFRWVLTTFAIAIASYTLPFIEISGPTVLRRIQTAFLAGLLLGAVNLVIKPLVHFLTLPINFLTLGLFNIVINAAMLWIVDYFIEGFKISGFWGYIWSSLLISIITVILTKIFLYEKKGKKNDNDS